MTKTTTFAVGYLLTGDVSVGGAIALVEPAVNTVGFYFHERLWRHIEGRRAATGPEPGASAGTQPM